MLSLFACKAFFGCFSLQLYLCLKVRPLCLHILIIGTLYSLTFSLGVLEICADIKLVLYM